MDDSQTARYHKALAISSFSLPRLSEARHLRGGNILSMVRILSPLSQYFTVSKCLSIRVTKLLGSSRAPIRGHQHETDESASERLAQLRSISNVRLGSWLFLQW